MSIRKALESRHEARKIRLQELPRIYSLAEELEDEVTKQKLTKELSRLMKQQRLDLILLKVMDRVSSLMRGRV